MDCHLNCHGELNMLVVGFPILLGVLLRARAAVRRFVLRVRGR